ncbi:MAG: bacillithiol biosynthesis BshC [Lentisphaeria bacterium]|nr:bacillithiol biosynthesis BshC [Lentisphaeria bacterium]
MLNIRLLKKTLGDESSYKGIRFQQASNFDETMFTCDREALKEKIKSYYHDVNEDLPKLSLSKLSQSNSRVVVTGQQAGILGGPLYTILKIISTINWSYELEKSSGIPYIPVFWNATEDHDYSEIGWFNGIDSSWKANLYKEGNACEKLETTPDFFAQLNSEIQKLPVLYRDEILSLVSNQQNNYGHFSSSFLMKLFKETPLVIIEPYIFREGNADFFEKVLNKQSEIITSLQSNGTNLNKFYFEPEEEQTGLFYIDESGQRISILQSINGLQVAGEHIPKGRITEWLLRHEKQISTSAFIRPVFQNYVLPVELYVGGPGEVAYHQQIVDIYGILGVNKCKLTFRNHATLIPYQVHKLISKFAISDIHLFCTYDEYLAQYYEYSHIQGKDHIELLTNKQYQMVQQILKEENLNETDNLLVFYQRELSKLNQRFAKKAARLNFDQNVGKRQILKTIFDCCYPGVPQERKLNILYFIGVYGPQLIPALVKQLNPLEKHHYLIELMP